ncbi:hypothetical protein IT575_15075 [bacterium]|nr:hypothetical protein [bacterium]
MLDSATRNKLLRIIMLADFAVLAVLGLLLIFAAEPMFTTFHLDFGSERALGAARYIVGMWGALMATMGLGYYFAAQNVAQSRSWVLAGLARAVIEVVVSVLALTQGLVSFRTAGLGMFLALWFAIAYLILLPRPGAVPESELAERSA